MSDDPADVPELTPDMISPKRNRQKRMLTAEDVDKLVEQTAEQVIKGESIRYARRGPPLGEATEDDKKAIQRVTGLTAEEFNGKLSKRLEEFDAKLAAKLGEASEVLANKLTEYAKNGKLTAPNIAFALSVAENMRARLEGKSAIQNASVNIAITQYNGSDPNFDRDKLLEALKPKTKSVINVEAVEATQEIPPP